jgi:hypothetical protein
MQSHILMGNLPLDGVASPPIENAMASRTVPVGDPENPNFTQSRTVCLKSAQILVALIG